MKCVQVNENTVLLTLGDAIDLALSDKIGVITGELKREFKDWIIDITPSYTTILIEYEPLKLSANEVTDRVGEILSKYDPTQLTVDRKTIELPVYYHPEVAPDLEYLCEKLSIGIDELIELHAGKPYLVCAIGFAPGFGFLAEVDPKIQFPRKESPRKRVAAGSVGIADKQTAVYPADSPGGWQIIGNCPVQLFNPEKKEYMPFAVGDRIKFSQIDRDEYLSLGGKIGPC